MIRSSSRSALFALLMLAIGLLGFAAASARGETRVGGEVVVLCSDGGLVQIALDADGVPTGQAHLCPDLALSLLAAFSLELPDLSRPAGTVEVLAPLRTVAFATGEVTAQNARGPPVLV